MPTHIAESVSSEQRLVSESRVKRRTFDAAATGMGIAYLPDLIAGPYLQQGKLVPVLSDWCPAGPGLCIYYPRHRHVLAPLRAFIDVLKKVDIATLQ